MQPAPPSNRNFSLRFWRRPTVVRGGTLGSGVSGLGGLTLPIVLVIAAILLPIATMFVLALTGTDANWTHLWHNVLPRSVTDTAILALGVAITTSVVGCATAFLFYWEAMVSVWCFFAAAASVVILWHFEAKRRLQVART